MTLDKGALEMLDSNFAPFLAKVRESEAEDPGTIPEMAEYFEARCKKHVNGMWVTDWDAVAEYAAAMIQMTAEVGFE